MPKKKKGSKALVKQEDHPLAEWLRADKIKALISPTPRKHIYQRPGRGGMQFDYVSIGYVITQLDKVFGMAWSFEVEEVGDMMLLSKTGNIVVKGKLTINMAGFPTIIKQQYGSADVKMNRGAGKPVDIADDFKAAASDALKKCASMVGVARDVYFKDWDSYNSRKVEGGEVPTGAKVVTPEKNVDAYREDVFNLAKEVLGSKESIKAVLKETTGKESFKDLSEKELDKLAGTLAELTHAS